VFRLGSISAESLASHFVPLKGLHVIYPGLEYVRILAQEDWEHIVLLIPTLLQDRYSRANFKMAAIIAENKDILDHEVFNQIDEKTADNVSEDTQERVGNPTLVDIAITCSPEPSSVKTDKALWNKTTSPLFSKLLHSYPLKLQARYLSFYQEFVIPYLGPSPALPDRRWIPHLTHNSSPFEPSWNIQGEKSQIRFTFEPVRPPPLRSFPPRNLQCNL
jgi:hypothetical protein